MTATRICTVVGCQRKHAARGLCKMHYNATRALGKAATARYRATPAGKATRKAASARYNATPAGKAAHARYYAAAKEREQGPSKRLTALPLVSLPDSPQTGLEGQRARSLETRQRAFMRAMVASAQETTTWDARQYLVELLCKAQGVRVLRSSRRSTT